MTKIVLRRATDADSEFAYELRKSVFRPHVECIEPWIESDQRRLHHRRFEAYEYLIIESDEVAVGVLVVDRNPEQLKLPQMFVLPESQNKGIGAAFLDLVVESACNLKIPVSLQVMKVNDRAQQFFRKHGCVIVGETETHWLLEWRDS